jgi:hypothetical protein
MQRYGETNSPPHCWRRSERNKAFCPSTTDAGLRYLGCLTELRSLTLHDTAITNDGLIDLARSSALTCLCLEECRGVTDEGVAHHEKALPRCKIVRLPRPRRPHPRRRTAGQTRGSAARRRCHYPGGSGQPPQLPLRWTATRAFPALTPRLDGASPCDMRSV